MKLKLLHVSDSHIFSLTGNLTYIVEGPKGLMDRYYNMSKRMRLYFTRKESNHHLHYLENAVKDTKYDHLVFSGDLTQSSNYEEFCIGKSALSRIRGRLGSRFSITPGNHDILPNKDRVNFYRFFNVPRGCYVQPFREEGYCIIGIDSTAFSAGMRGPVSALEHAAIRSRGLICREQIKWLRHKLSGNFYRGLYKIVLLHHHPVTHRNDTLVRNIALPKVRNSRMFLKFLEKHKIDMVIYGHKHPKTTCYKRIGNTHFVLGPSIRDGLYNSIVIDRGNISIRAYSL